MEEKKCDKLGIKGKLDMRKSLMTGLLATGFSFAAPAFAEEEVIPDHAFQDVYTHWKGFVGTRIKVVGGFVAQAGMGDGYAAYIEQDSSDVLDIDTSKAIDPGAVTHLSEACGNFLTADKPDCRLDIVVTVEKNPLRDVPVLTQPNFVAP